MSSSSSSSSSDEEALEERRDCVYELLGHLGMLRHDESFKQASDELAAIFSTEALWVVCSKRLQSTFVDSAMSAI